MDMRCLVAIISLSLHTKRRPPRRLRNGAVDRPPASAGCAIRSSLTDMTIIPLVAAAMGDGGCGRGIFSCCWLRTGSIADQEEFQCTRLGFGQVTPDLPHRAELRGRPIRAFQIVIDCPFLLFEIDADIEVRQMIKQPRSSTAARLFAFSEKNQTPGTPLKWT